MENYHLKFFVLLGWLSLFLLYRASWLLCVLEFLSWHLLQHWSRTWDAERKPRHVPDVLFLGAFLLVYLVFTLQSLLMLLACIVSTGFYLCFAGGMRKSLLHLSRGRSTCCNIIFWLDLLCVRCLFIVWMSVSFSFFLVLGIHFFVCFRITWQIFFHIPYN